MKILALMQHRPDRSPGQRFRFEHYMEYLQEQGWEICFSNLLNGKDDKYFYSKANYFRKAFIALKSLFVRWKDLRRAKNFDIVFVYREAYMLGTTYFERKIAKKGIPLVFDFDDSIWLNDTSEGNKNLAWLKKPEKTAEICKVATMVMVGNEYLANYARQFSKNVVVVPTTIDTNYHKKENIAKQSETICIGWTGTTTTMKHFELIMPVFVKLKERFGDKISYRVITNRIVEGYPVDVEMLIWNKNREIEDLQYFDIGIMPLPDDEWSKGKCGFKGLQCMALSMPVVMSPVGVNVDIVEDGKNGYLAETEEEWLEKLSILIESENLRIEIGKKARKSIEEEYSVEVWKIRFDELLKTLLSKNRNEK